MEKRTVEVDVQEVMEKGEVVITDTLEVEGKAIYVKHIVRKASYADRAECRVEVSGAPSGRKYKTSVRRKLSESKTFGHAGNSNAGTILPLSSNLKKGDKFRFETIYETSPGSGLWRHEKITTVTY